jgi:hypothetical protein
MVISQLRYWLGKAQVPTDPGLSTAQLMLTNDDLRPGETNLSNITRFYLVINPLIRPCQLPKLETLACSKLVTLLICNLTSR